jgi:tetratricopeptide (TPR) repeat protein
MTKNQVKWILAVGCLAALPLQAQDSQNPAKKGTDPAGKQGDKQSQSTAANPASQASTDRQADSYYNFTMGRTAEEEYELSGRADYANQAIDYYKKALEGDPQSSVIIERLAETYAKSQRVPEAIAEAQKAVSADPNNPEPHRLLARIYVRNLGDLSANSAQKQTIDKAIEQFNEILRLDPHDSQSALWLARLYRFENDPDKAEKTLRDVLANDPENDGALEQLSQLLTDQGRTNDAIELLSKAANSSSSATVYDLLGDAHLQAHEYAKAEEAYKQAVDLDPDEPSHRKGLAQTLLAEEKFPDALKEYQKLAETDPDSAENYLRMSQIYRHMSQFDKAESSIVKAKQMAPGNLEILYNEALLYDAEGRLDDAAHVLADAIAGISGESDAASPNALGILYEELGRVYREKEDYTSAEHCYEDMAKLGSEQAKRAQMLLIDTYRESHNVDRAISETQKALKENPNDRGLMVTEAILLGEKNQTDEADKILNGMLEHSAADQEIYLDLAQVQERGRHYADAEKSAQKAEELSDDDSEKASVWFMLGAIYERQKKFDQAEAEFKKALQADPNNAAVLNYYGYMLADRGIRLDEANRYIKQALDQEPANGAYLDSMGWVCYKQNKLAEAEEYLKKAADRSAHDPTILGHLGDVYAKMGRTELAANFWEKALTEWQRALPADYEQDQVTAIDQHLKNVNKKLAHKQPNSDESSPQ